MNSSFATETGAAALLVDYVSCIFKAGFAGVALFPSLVSGSFSCRQARRQVCITVGMDQLLLAYDARHHGRYGSKRQFSVFVAALIADFGSGMCLAGFVGDDTFHVVFPSVVVRDVRHHGRYEPEGQLYGEMPRSSSTPAVACARLVFLVLFLALCSLLLSAGPCWRGSCRSCNDRFPGPASAGGGAVLGHISLARRCATTGAGVGQDIVLLLDKIVGMPVVGPHGPHSAEARGASTGAVLGRGYCHFDRCRGPDSVNCLEVAAVLQLLFEGRRHPCLYAVADPVQKIIEIHQFVDMVADFSVVRSYRSPQVVHTPVVSNDRCPGYVPQLQFTFKVVHITVEAQRFFPMFQTLRLTTEVPSCSSIL